MGGPAGGAGGAKAGEMLGGALSGKGGGMLGTSSDEV
jgi:hypothetical protein